jgi:hypothetical protein
VDTTTRFNAFLQLKGDADPGGRFLIDQTAPHVQAQYHYNVDSTTPVAAAPQTQSAWSGSCSARHACSGDDEAVSAAAIPRLVGDCRSSSRRPNTASRYDFSVHDATLHGVLNQASSRTRSVSDAVPAGRYSEGLLHVEEKFKRSRLACGGEKAPDRDAACFADLQGVQN